MKGILESRTIWVALLIFVGSILQATGIINVPLQETAVWIGMAIGVIQFILRLITKKEIVIK